MKAIHFEMQEVAGFKRSVITDYVLNFSVLSGKCIAMPREAR